MDLTTEVIDKLDSLLPGDQTTEFDAYCDGVRSVAGSLDDLNTALWLDLT
jgi:hypothetical protein